MKAVWLITILLILPLGLSAGVVNNSGSAAADSISIPFFALDSVGNMTALTTGDSVTWGAFIPQASSPIPW